MVNKTLKVSKRNRRLLSDVKRLNLKENDIIIFRTKTQLSLDAITNIRASLQPVFVNHKILILEEGADIELISPE